MEHVKLEDLHSSLSQFWNKEFLSDATIKQKDFLVQHGGTQICLRLTTFPELRIYGLNLANRTLERPHQLKQELAAFLIENMETLKKFAPDMDDSLQGMDILKPYLKDLVNLDEKVKYTANPNEFGKLEGSISEDEAMTRINRAQRLEAEALKTQEKVSAPQAKPTNESVFSSSKEKERYPSFLGGFSFFKSKPATAKPSDAKPSPHANIDNDIPKKMDKSS